MTREQAALVRIAKLCRLPNHRVSRQFRLLEIALEGLGVPTRTRDEEIAKVIQSRRDLVEQRRAAAATLRGDHEAAT